MTLEEFTSTVKPFHEERTWDETLTFMMEDPSERLIIERLAELLRSGQPFNERIAVGDADEEDGGGIHVWNGIHRSCAHLLTGIGPMEVAHYQESFSEDETTTTITGCWETSATFSNEDTAVHNAQRGEDEDDYFALRSFPVGDNGWADADLASIHNGDELCTVRYVWSSTTPADHADFHAAFTRNAELLGYPLPTSLETVWEEDDYDEES